MKKKPNVLLITPNYPPFVTGGAGVYFATLAKYLDGSECLNNIYLLTEYGGSQPLFSNVHRKTIIYRLLVPRGSRSKGWSRLKLFKLFSFLSNIILLPLSITAICIFKKINIIHIHSSFFVPSRKVRMQDPILVYFFWFLRKALKIQVINDCRDHFTVPLTDKHFDKLICASESILTDCEQKTFYPKKCGLIPVIFDAEKVLNEVNDAGSFTPPVEKYIFFAGTITEEKGVLELLGAFENKDDFLQDYSLVLVGANLIGDEFLTTIKNRSDIIYMGPQPHRVVLKLMSHASLVILPSKFEGMPRVCLEAMALKKPVLLPPNIPEFDKQCPEFVLPVIESNTIRRMMTKSLTTEMIASYPLQSHSIDRIGEKLILLYLNG